MGKYLKNGIDHLSDAEVKALEDQIEEISNAPESSLIDTENKEDKMIEDAKDKMRNRIKPPKNREDIENLMAICACKDMDYYFYGLGFQAMIEADLARELVLKAQEDKIITEKEVDAIWSRYCKIVEKSKEAYNEAYDESYKKARDTSENKDMTGVEETKMSCFHIVPKYPEGFDELQKKANKAGMLT
ncbi:MAG: hypothetical protein ACOCUI_00160 [bacterium]